MESELFGHVKGAFTGAVAAREGAVKRAEGGTLFLDEICEMELQLQTKLLRFLQTATYIRVGGEQVEKADVRIVCATNRDPLKEVEEGNFREDLYYRVHVIPLHLPPLREREGDVVEIARHLLRIDAAREGKQFEGFTAEAENLLLRYPWPGNVRQLQNVILNAVVLNDGPLVAAEMLPPPVNTYGSLQGQITRATVAAPTDRVGATVNTTIRTGAARAGAESAIRPLWLVEKEAIEAAIAACDGNIPRAAAALGISASTIYRKKSAWEAAGALRGRNRADRRHDTLNPKGFKTVHEKSGPRRWIRCPLAGSPSPDEHLPETFPTPNFNNCAMAMGRQVPLHRTLGRRRRHREEHRTIRTKDNDNANHRTPER